MDNKALLEALSALVNRVQDGVDAETVKLNTNVVIELRDANGNLKDKRELHNALSFTGRNLILAATGGKLPAAFSFVGVGTGTTAPAGSPCSDTALGAEIASSRQAGTVSNSTAGTSSTQAVLQISASFAAGVGTGAITESALFDATSAGNMLARQTFAAVNKGASDTLTIQWSLS